MGGADDGWDDGERQPVRSAEADGADVTASEVAAYAYCAKAWHLERVLMSTASEEAARRRAAGTERHAAHGARVARLQLLAPVLRWTIVILLVLALLLAGLALSVGR